MWTVQEAKAKLSEVLKRAKAGEPQVIGAQDPCIVISMAEYQRLRDQSGEPHLGRWLVENAPRGFELELPQRGDDRPDPFAWIDKVGTDAFPPSAKSREAKTKKRRM